MIKLISHKIKHVLHDPFIQWIVKGMVVLVILYALIGLWKWHDIPPQIPLFYSLPRSVDQLGGKWELLLLPFFSLLYFCFNFFIAAILYQSEKLAATLLLITGFISSILLFLAFSRIIFLIS